MDTEIKTIGTGQPKIAVVGCVHGNEPIGRLAIDQLKKLKLESGQLTLITAHCKALKQNKRFIEMDLNRAFPGKEKGCLEERIAYQLTSILKQQDLVLDIHATNSDFQELVLLHHLNQKIKQALNHLPLSRVALVGDEIFKSQSLIHCCDNALCLEYGPDKSGRNFKRAVAHIKTLLINLDMISGKPRIYPRKTLYTVKEAYPIGEDFKQSTSLKDFQKIKKNQYLGLSNGKKLYSKKEFYPIFLGAGRYEDTLALMAEKQKLEL